MFLAVLLLSFACFSTEHDFLPAHSFVSQLPKFSASQHVQRSLPGPRMQGADSVDIGRLVEFQTKSGDAVLGAVVGADGKKNWKVTTATGREMSIPPRAIRHIVAGSAGVLSGEAVAQFEDSLPVAEEAGLQELWEMALEENSFFSLDELSELLHGDASPRSRYATHLSVGSGVGRMLFRARSPGAYAPRPARDVNALRFQAEAEAARAAAEEALRERVQRTIQVPGMRFDIMAESEAVQADFAALARLGSYAAVDNAETASAEEPTDGRARDLLRRLGRKVSAASAAALLKQLGLWSAHENLDVIRLRAPTDFPPSLLAAADRLATNPPPDPDAARRKDLTHLVALAIDDETTVEVDDALSVESDDGGLQIWIHIADPSRYIALGSALDAEARRRGSTVYLPTGQFFMFPPTLASGSLSLRPDTVSCALSIGLRLDAAGAIAQTSITPSLVRVQRLAYSEVDDLLARFDAGDSIMTPTLDTLRRLEFVSEKRLSWRIQGGCMQAVAPEELPDMNIVARSSADAPDGWDVHVGLGNASRRTGVARRIVTEGMLLAGEAVARYGVDQNIPMAFYGQTRKRELSDKEIDECPPGPCRWWLAVRQMSPSVVTPDPRPHEGLGLDAYIQVTSPIRRYADLALHHQLKAYLRGDALPFPNASELVSLAAEGSQLARLLERRAREYWLQEYLRRHASLPFPAMVLGTSNAKRATYKLLLDDLGAVVDCKSAVKLKLGAKVEVAPDSHGKLTI